MKRKALKICCISFLPIFIILLSVSCAFCGASVKKTEYLRIHVRANSNSEDDQRVKYLVRDVLVDKLAPIAAECRDKTEAVKKIKRIISELERASDDVLKANNFAYKTKIGVYNEKFPTRVYDGEVFDGGSYDALIVSLGKGEGDNWWCVVYPPLCFSGAKPIYRSKIAEIIRNFNARKK